MDARGRLHSLDNLRAIMMWLGIVLHVADLHLVRGAVLPWRDSQSSAVADLLVGVIHAFRMPVFFIVAGFFVSLLVERRGIASMLSNRLRRIGIPFVVFWPVLFAVVVLLTTLRARPPGSALRLGFDLQAMPLMPDGSRWQTMHLWFLQILIGLVVAAALVYGVVQRIPRGHRERAIVLFERLASRWWAFLPLALPLSWVSRHYPFGILSASGLLVPRGSEWVFNGEFFAFGLGLYLCRDRLLLVLQRRCWANAAGGLVAFGLTVVLAQITLWDRNALPRPRLWTGLAYNVTTWLWCLALLGVFTRYVARPRPLLKYASDSSYWVYLVHLPCLGAVSLVLRDWPVGAGARMLINIGATSAIAALSYQLFVRHTAIGTLLNGPRVSETTGAPAMDASTPA